jgi:DNA-directed RNA polymerase specialized sigma24 family protein
MPRHPHPTLSWGTLETGYTDEFGVVAPDIYDAAGRVWRQSRDYAARVLRDVDDARARTLLLKSAAKTTRARDEKTHHINDLDGYLFQTFKRVVLAELEKDNNRHRFEMEAHVEAEWHAQANNVERRILIDELVAAMDEWMRAVFEWLTLDYSFDEIAWHLGMNVKVLRNRYNRRLTALVKQFEGVRAEGKGRGAHRE